MTSPTATSTPPFGTKPIPSPKQQFLEAFERESAVTSKVIDAFPADQSEFKPHEKSSSARRLAWTFSVEAGAIVAALKDQFEIKGGFPPAPETWPEVVSTFRKTREMVISTISQARDEDFAGTVSFFVGPKTLGDVPKMDFCWFMLSDQIHHRGQLSVYVRMTGGKVPSIYGPSADEPWR